MEDIVANIKEVRERIEKARERSPYGQEVTLIAVTKTHGPDVVQVAKDCGITEIGENKVQELTKKMDYFGDSLNYHLIGSLQTNKVKYIYDKVKLIHSLDRINLAKEINKRAKDLGRPVKCLVQVNIGREETKGGVDPDEVEEFIEQVRHFPNIRIMGLMCLAPNIDDREELRGYFQKMYKIREKIAEKGYNELDMKYLSMGMSNDFEIAIEEGANLVRVGSALFGLRDYSK